MRLQTQFTVPKKDWRDLDYIRKMQNLEKTLKQSCKDYPSEEDCLVCCNSESINNYFLQINSNRIC